ncbi:MAG: hypothetical protein ABI894_06435 [Ilumatobacteraceae bacterium]
MKATDDGGSVSYVAGNGLVVIGEGHDLGYVSYAGSAADASQGAITVSKARVFSDGSLEVSGCSTDQQGAVRAMLLESFSNKTVEFV